MFSLSQRLLCISYWRCFTYIAKSWPNWNTVSAWAEACKLVKELSYWSIAKCISKFSSAAAERVFLNSNNNVKSLYSNNRNNMKIAENLRVDWSTASRIPRSEQKGITIKNHYHCPNFDSQVSTYYLLNFWKRNSTDSYTTEGWFFSERYVVYQREMLIFLDETGAHQRSCLRQFGLKKHAWKDIAILSFLDVFVTSDTVNGSSYWKASHQAFDGIVIMDNYQCSRDDSRCRCNC